MLPEVKLKMVRRPKAAYWVTAGRRNGQLLVPSTASAPKPGTVDKQAEGPHCQISSSQRIPVPDQCFC